VEFRPFALFMVLSVPKRANFNRFKGLPPSLAVPGQEGEKLWFSLDNYLYYKEL
jgi:hypothetical protein